MALRYGSTRNVVNFDNSLPGKPVGCVENRRSPKAISVYSLSYSETQSARYAPERYFKLWAQCSMFFRRLQERGVMMRFLILDDFDQFIGNVCAADRLTIPGIETRRSMACA